MKKYIITVLILVLCNISFSQQGSDLSFFQENRWNYIILSGADGKKDKFAASYSFGVSQYVDPKNPNLRNVAVTYFHHAKISPLEVFDCSAHRTVSPSFWGEDCFSRTPNELSVTHCEVFEIIYQEACGQ